MDKKIQRRILEVVMAQRGDCLMSLIESKVTRQHWPTLGTDDIDGRREAHRRIGHQVDLLVAEGKLVNEPLSTRYIITPAGYMALAPAHKRAWTFLLYGKNNLFAAIAIIISLLSLIVSYFH